MKKECIHMRSDVKVWAFFLLWLVLMAITVPLVTRDKKGDTPLDGPNGGTAPTISRYPEKCGGYRSKAIECGSDDDRHAASCCEGYKCDPNQSEITCVAASKEYEPLSIAADPFVQMLPIELDNGITVVETIYRFTDTGDMNVTVPQAAKRGDLLIIFIGGSAGKKRPDDPDNFKLILSKGRSDINLMAMYKWYDEDDDEEVTIGGGRNTFVTLSAVRGVDRKNPVVDSMSTRESAPGKDGKAVAPSAFGVEGGAIFAAFSYDDPHVAQLQTDGYEIVVSTDAAGGDGMAVFVSSSENTGYTEEVFVASTPQKGGGNDVSMTVTLRPNGGPYDEPPSRIESSEIRDERRGDY